MAVFETAGDEPVSARAWTMLGWDYIYAMSVRGRCRAARRGLGYTRRLPGIGNSRSSFSVCWGTTSGGPCRCRRVSPAAMRCPWGGAAEGWRRMLLAHRASLLAMGGEIGEARTIYAEAKTTIDELGRPLRARSLSNGAGTSRCSPEIRPSRQLTLDEYERLLETVSLGRQTSLETC